MSTRRLLTYYRHRIGRLPGTPHVIALGFAGGFAVSLTPFIGFHILLGFLLCLVLRASVIAMVIGTVAGGNPWTFPFIWVATYKLGTWMLPMTAGAEGALHNISLKTLIKNPVDLLLPMTLGSLPLGLALGIVSYYGVKYVLVRYRGQRDARWAARRQQEDEVS